MPQDVPGRLAGNWFHESVPVSDSASPSAWSRHLSFAFDTYDPSRVRVAIGGTLPLIGAFPVPAGAPDPRDVTPSTGRVVYRLLQTGGAGDAPGAQRGVLAVELIDAATIRVEAAADGSAVDLPFTAAARRYVRRAAAHHRLLVSDTSNA